MIDQLHIEILIKKGDIDAAYVSIKKALKMYPNYRAFVYDLANYFIEKKSIDEAIKHLKNYISIFRI